MLWSLAFALAASFAAGGTVDVTITDCCDATCKGTIKTLNNPGTCPSPGDCKAGGTGTLDEDVTDAKLEVQVMLGSAKVLDKTVDACGHVDIPLPLGLGSVGVDALAACPAKAGPMTVAVDVSNKIALPSKVTSHAVAKDSSGSTLLCLDLTFTPKKDVEEVFENYMQRFGKSYSDENTRALRLELFKSNYNYINSENAKGSNLYQLGVNAFTDLSRDEFSEQMFGFKPPTEQDFMAVHEYQGEELAASVDWRTSGAVTPVKNQGQCGSCWSFSTTGALEGAWKISQGSLVSLSEEEFVQCDTGSSGCGGGSMQQAFSWAKAQNICTESSYPYTSGGGSGGSCHKSGCSVGIPQGGVVGYKSVARSEQSLMSALNLQPVSIAVEADKSVFQSYKSGIMTGSCGTQLDHGILAVGYGTDAGQDYWIIKNSWGTVWGEQGFGRFLRGKNSAGECGILMQASYPQVSGAPGLAVTVSGSSVV